MAVPRELADVTFLDRLTSIDNILAEILEELRAIRTALTAPRPVAIERPRDLLEAFQSLALEVRSLKEWLVPSKPNIDFVDLDSNNFEEFDKAMNAVQVILHNTDTQDIEYAYERNERQIMRLAAGDRQALTARPGVIYLRRTSSASTPRIRIEWWEP